MPKRKQSSAAQPTVVVKQNNNVLYLILAVLVVSLGYMFVRMMSLEKRLATGSTGVQQESYLSVEKLKQYAKELKLNTGDFNKCLDGNTKQAAVNADVAYGTSVGVQGTPGFFVNGKFLAGAFPFEFFKEIIDKELAGTGSEVCTDYSTDLQAYCSDPQNLNFNPVPQKIDVNNTQALGPTSAKIQLVEFSDFECPYCTRAYPTVKQILNDYKGQVIFYYKQFPLIQIHPNAQKSAEASLCAADQGKFWEYHDKLFETGLTQTQ